MTTLTQEQLDNASADATSLAKFINDGRTVANPGHPTGTLTTRGGATYDNLAKIVHHFSDEGVLADVEAAAAEARAAAESIRFLATPIYAMGNSITQNNGFLSRLAARLGDGYSFINRGVNGQWTNQMVQRFNDDMLVIGDIKHAIFACDAINNIMLCEVVDNSAGLTLANVFDITTSHLQAMYTSAKSHGATVHIGTDLPFKPYALWSSDKQAVLEAINYWKMHTAINVDHRLDLYALFLDPGEPYTPLSSLVPGLPADFHPGTAGQVAIGDYFYDNVPFTKNTAPARIQVTRPLTKMDQDVDSNSDVRWRSGSFGHAPSSAAAMTLRSRNPLADEFQLVLEQFNPGNAGESGASSGWAWWASAAGDLRAHRLESGILRPATLTLVRGDFSTFADKLWIAADGLPFRVTSADFRAGVGTGVDIHPVGTAGFGLIAYSAGGDYGSWTQDAAAYDFKINGASKLTLDGTGLLTVLTGVAFGNAPQALGSAFNVGNSGAGRVASFKNSHATAGDKVITVAGGAVGADVSSQLIEFYDGTVTNYQGGIFRNGAGAVSYATSSDRRGKPNRELLDRFAARAVIDELKIWDFDKEGNAIRGVGVIAQEAHKVSKYFAMPGKDKQAWWTAEKAAPVPYLIAAQQLMHRVSDDHARRIARLETIMSRR
jgi:hypothetical protein